MVETAVADHKHILGFRPERDHLTDFIFSVSIVLNRRYEFHFLEFKAVLAVGRRGGRRHRRGPWLCEMRRPRTFVKNGLRRPILWLQ